MKFKKEFLGLDGFYWWFGVVEDRMDPMALGRCRVRVFGAHNESLSDIPTEDLPWAHPANSVNSHMFSTPKEGEYVFGFFIDGKYGQQPVIVGTIPGYAPSQADSSKGFHDTRSLKSIADAPKKPASLSYNTDGSGVSITEPDFSKDSVIESFRFPNDSQKGKPTPTGLSRYVIDNTVVKSRKDNLDKVVTADGQHWNEPQTPYNTDYPYNQVLETESGHAFEMDDTPGHERVALSHRSGTFFEYFPSGTKVEKITKQNFQIVMADDHIHIMGRAKITVDSDCYIKVLGDVKMEAMNNVDLKVSDSMNLSVKNALNIKAASLNIDISGQTDLNSGGQINMTSGDVTSVSASQISTTSLGVLGMFTVGGGTNLLAVGMDSHGDGHALAVIGPGASSPNPATPAGIADPADVATRNTATWVETAPADKAAFMVDSGEPEAAAHIAEQISSGVYTKEEIAKGAAVTAAGSQIPANTTPPPTDLPVNNACGGIEKLTDFPNTLQISKYFTLGKVTGQAPCGDPLKEQRGLTMGQIACNLKLLAMNCLDPIKEKYPSMSVTNAFRYPIGAAAGRSQHEIGQAADMQFNGYSKAQYYDIVLWIRDNVPHDQLLLEYKTVGSGNPWIHISFKGEGNRPPGGAKNATFMNHAMFKTGYVNLGLA